MMEHQQYAGVSITGNELRRITAISIRGRDPIDLALRSELDHAADRDGDIEDLLRETPPEAQREIAELLGDRFPAFERSKDAAFQEFAGASERLSLPMDSAVKAYEIRRAAESAARDVRNAPGMDAQQRRAALEAMRKETEQALASVVGSPAVKEFFQSDRGWARSAFGAREAKQ
jgi:hypothetical protein